GGGGHQADDAVRHPLAALNRPTHATFPGWARIRLQAAGQAVRPLGVRNESKTSSAAPVSTPRSPSWEVISGGGASRRNRISVMANAACTASGAAWKMSRAR